MGGNRRLTSLSSVARVAIGSGLALGGVAAISGLTSSPAGASPVELGCNYNSSGNSEVCGYLQGGSPLITPFKGGANYTGSVSFTGHVQAYQEYTSPLNGVSTSDQTITTNTSIFTPYVDWVSGDPDMCVVLWKKTSSGYTNLVSGCYDAE